MKKFIAILFLLVVGISSLPINEALQHYSYEIMADGEQPESECKEEKKEGKDYIVHSTRNFLTSLLSGSYNSIHCLVTFPQPVLDQQTPPPDAAC